jgi:hypothetical protein
MMSERKTVFLNGAAFWYPLVGSIFSLASLGISSVGSGFHVPFVVLGGILSFNLMMLLSCRSAFGRWLGRTKLHDIGFALSSLLLLVASLALSGSSISNITALFGFTSWISSLLCLIFSLTTSVTASSYIEDSQGQMVDRFDGESLQAVMKGRVLRSGDRLMRRNWFGSALIHSVEGIEWLAWRPQDIGNDEKAITVFGRDIASARQYAAPIMSINPDLILVVPKETKEVFTTELDELARQYKLRQQAALDEEERLEQEQKAEVDALQNRICSENSPLLLEENHATHMNRLFAQAIGAPHNLIIVDKN